jgi:hypothetical protein
MAQILVRNVEDGIKETLRKRAKARGHSLEEEVREILSDAARASAPSDGLGRSFAALFGGKGYPKIPDVRSAESTRPLIDFSGPEFGVYDDEV